MTGDDDAAQRYARDGAVVVRGALDDDAIALAAEGIDAAVAERGPRTIVASPDGDPGLFVEDFRCAERVPALARLARWPSLAALAADLMGSATVRFHHDHVLVKRAGTRQPTPWHQDQPYYDIDGRQTVSFWIPVDPVSASASLEVALGSHRGPWYLPRTFLDEQARWFPEGSLAEIPDMDADPPAFPTRCWALEPGDLVAFHMATLHRAGPAPPDRDRRVVSLRYVGDDVVHAPRAWTTSPTSATSPLTSSPAARWTIRSSPWCGRRRSRPYPFPSVSSPRGRRPPLGSDSLVFPHQPRRSSQRRHHRPRRPRQDHAGRRVAPADGSTP